jgi:hypothetical protein
MEGWRGVIRDGEWLVVRPVQGVGFAAVEGEVVIVARGADEGLSVHVKRVVKGADGGWWLRSDAVGVADVGVGAEDEVVGVVVNVVQQVC